MILVVALSLALMPYLSEAFSCFSCVRGSSSNVMYNIAMQHMLPDELRKSGLIVPDYDTQCGKNPSKSATCQRPNPPMDFGIQNLKDLKEMQMTIRGCLDAMMPDAGEVTGDAQLMAELAKLDNIGCIQTKGHAMGATGAAQFCACRGERCNMQPAVDQLPPLANPPTSNAPAQFGYYDCMSASANDKFIDLAGMFVGGMAMGMMEDNTIQTHNQQNWQLTEQQKADLNSDSQCYEQPKAANGQCSDYAVTLGGAVDFMGYNGPASIGPPEAGINADLIKSLEKAKGIGRTCLGELLPGEYGDAVKQFTQNLQDDMCIWVDGTVMGIKGQAMGCACNSDKCNGKAFVPKANNAYRNTYCIYFIALVIAVIVWQ